DEVVPDFDLGCCCPQVLPEGDSLLAFALWWWTILDTDRQIAWLTKCKPPSGDILQRGGSAVDGAIAALLCTSVINPQSMGIGGGRVKIINSRETIPQEFNPDLLSGCPQIFQLMTASQWIGVPGEIHGYEQAHWLFGKLPKASFFHTTIKLAREGFPVPQVLRHFIPLINRDETLPLRCDGNLLTVGDTVKFEQFADTLEIIANQGADASYTGKVAEDLICNVKDMLLSLKFTEQQFADHFRAMISSDETHDAQYYIDGTAVSVTITINHMFGSRVFSPKTGVIFNNELSDVCGKADHNVTSMMCFMVWLASEQPPSSMSAVVLQSKYRTLVTGGSGGSMITTGMALVSDHGINYIGSTYTLYICKYIELHNNKYPCNTQLLHGYLQGNTCRHHCFAQKGLHRQGYCCQ
uniref:Gamma-glutamyltransferase 5a n=1 Tax=Hucho hucho TaxID=62062 RepID=A0A4W5M5F5_9TELE